MIKQTFYNLPGEKRQRVVRAIVSEFSEMSDEKISINRIVKRAGISRGSFYQYFDDKVDLVEVLLKSVVEVAMEGVHRATEESGGDIFYTYELLLDILAAFSDDSVNRAVMRRLARNLHANNDLVSEYMSNRFNGIGDFKDCAKQFSRERLRYQSDSDFELLLQMLTGLLKNALFNYYAMDEDFQSVQQSYRRKLEILKNGAVQ